MAREQISMITSGFSPARTICQLDCSLSCGQASRHLYHSQFRRELTDFHSSEGERSQLRISELQAHRIERNVGTALGCRVLLWKSLGRLFAFSRPPHLSGSAESHAGQTSAEPKLLFAHSTQKISLMQNESTAE
jgi:hypothetical protein